MHHQPSFCRCLLGLVARCERGQSEHLIVIEFKNNYLRRGSRTYCCSGQVVACDYSLWEAVVAFLAVSWKVDVRLVVNVVRRETGVVLFVKNY
jgi:hypothetical protein